VLIFDLKESGDIGAIAVLSLAMVALTTLVIAIANRLGGGRVRLQTRMAG
jgi:iron(III) transport system permease protein